MKEKDSDDEEEMPTYRVILVGEYGVGKTSIIKRLTYGNFKEDTTPASATYAKKIIKLEKFKGKALQFGIWATVGQKKYRSLTKSILIEATAAIIVYDITKKHSFEEIKNFWYNHVIECSPEEVNMFFFFFNH